MANIDELIIQAQNVIEELNGKLKKIEEVHKDIKSLRDSSKEIPEQFSRQFKEIIKLSHNYTEVLGKATNTYLKGNNQMLVKNLQAFESKNGLLQEKINSLDKEILRIENVDLETHFRNLQKTLADIYSSVNSINVTFGQTTQTLNIIVQTITTMQNTLYKDKTQLLTHFKEIKDNLTLNRKEVESNLAIIVQENKKFRDQIGSLRLIQLLNLIVFIIIVILIIIKCQSTNLG